MGRKEELMKKWYLKTWFICLMFFLWFIYGIPIIIGIVLLILQNKEFQKLQDQYGNYDDLVDKTNALSVKYKNKMQHLENEYLNETEMLEKDFTEKKASITSSLNHLISEYQQLSEELSLLESNTLVAHYNFSDYAGITSEECKNKLAILKQTEKELVQSESALHISSKGTRKVIRDNSKQILRCFNSECDNILMNLSVKNIDAMRKKISASFESLNKIFSVDGISIDKQLLELKLEELNLAYTFEIKKECERDQQKAIKEQMLEEEKVRREIERQKAKITKDQTQCNNEIKKLMSYLQKTQNDVEKQLYINKISELEEKLSLLEKDKETILEREANAKAGFVYVISNIGSFGKDIYKIGMTRRLEPMDRIKELSSASVPFEFDVHAMIFSDNAPELEATLHKYFEKRSVNRVNLRKEFFNVTLEEIESIVKSNYNNTVEFTKIPDASEYRQTLEILKNE